jgi:hypothetical protein
MLDIRSGPLFLNALIPVFPLSCQIQKDDIPTENKKT